MQNYIETAIPSACSLGMQVVRCQEDEVVIRAPLQTNRNHVGTAFGGSLNSLLTLSAWAWLFNKLQTSGQASEVVIQSATTDYLLPVATDDIVAQCQAPSQEAWARFYKVFQRKGLGRVTLTAEVFVGGQVAVRFRGQFVASRR